MTEKEAETVVTVKYLELAEEIFSDELVFKARLQVLVDKGIVRMICGKEPKRKTMVQLLHDLMPSFYSEEVLLGLEGSSLPEPPELDEPFNFAYDEPHEVNDGDIIEICMEAEEGDFVGEAAGVNYKTAYEEIENPTLDDLLSALKMF